jgi:hypothetical protein
VTTWIGLVATYVWATLCFEFRSCIKRITPSRHYLTPNLIPCNERDLSYLNYCICSVLFIVLYKFIAIIVFLGKLLIICMLDKLLQNILKHMNHL